MDDKTLRWIWISADEEQQHVWVITRLLSPVPVRLPVRQEVCGDNKPKQS
jgi:hypothetical protein